MRSLRDIYEEINKNNEWSYYQNPNIDLLDGLLSDFSGKRSVGFIQKYFNIAGKSRVFEDKQIITHREIIERRANHIISTFLIGIVIAKGFGIDINQRDDENFNFKYFWFLTCLYHDIGYVYEGDINCDNVRAVHKGGFEELKRICNLHYFNNSIFKSVDSKQAELYLKERARSGEEHCNVLDHGIVGGVLLYDKLRIQFENAFRKRIDKNDNRSDFYIRNECDGRILHLAKSHYEAYEKAADAIIRHNIFNNTLKEYILRTNSADIKPIKDSISLDNELCFVLSIADTIEPVKRGISYLDKVYVECLPDNKGIRLKADVTTYCSVYENIKSLETWVNVKVTVTNDEMYKYIEIKVG